jgi:threonyl-tRNA synthetase
MEECLKINDQMLSIYKDFGFEDIFIKLSTRPEKRVGADHLWDKAEKALSDVLDEVTERSNGRLKTAINPGEGAFYGPKLEYVLKDAIGRDWQCGTTQVDFNLAGRLGAFYIDEHSEKKTPVMIHRAMFGSLERFTGILIENFAGHFPLWLAPLQAVVAPIVSDANAYALEVADKLQAVGLRVETDLRNEKINYKVREHSLAKVPVIVVVGKREAEEHKVSIRRFGSQEQTVVGEDYRPLSIGLDGERGPGPHASSAVTIDFVISGTGAFVRSLSIQAATRPARSFPAALRMTPSATGGATITTCSKEPAAASFARSSIMPLTNRSSARW